MKRTSIYKELPQILFTLMAVVFLTGCQMETVTLSGFLGESSTDPKVDFGSISPPVGAGNSSTVFTFPVSYDNIDNVNLQISDITVETTGTVTCSAPTINNGNTLNPTVQVSGCSGDGTIKIVISPGTGQTGSGGSDSGSTSVSIDIDNTVPSVVVGSPTPTTGDSSNTYTFPVTYSNSSTHTLTPSDITVNVTGVACAAPTVSNGTTATPTVSLTSCTGTGTVGITVGANTSTDLAGNANLASAASATVAVTNGIGCPTGGAPGEYLEIPGNAFYGTSAFCVMKYEAKARRDSDSIVHPFGCDNDTVILTGDAACSGASDNWVQVLGQPYTPVSQAESIAWRKISRNEASSECRSLNSEGNDANIDSDTNGDGTFNLITNDEWQTIARDLESVAANWSENVVGGVSTGNGGTNANYMNIGHGDGVPNEPIEGDSDDSWACVNTGDEVAPGTDYTCPGGWHHSKRTHTLSNGGTIWDFSGNVWEWAMDTNSFSYGNNAQFFSITNITHTISNSLSGGITTTSRTAKNQFGPLNDYTSLSNAENGGLGHGNLTGSSGGLLRGGSHAGGGMFGTYTTTSFNTAYTDTGFRCVFRP